MRRTKTAADLMADFDEVVHRKRTTRLVKGERDVIRALAEVFGQYLVERGFDPEIEDVRTCGGEPGTADGVGQGFWDQIGREGEELFYREAERYVLHFRE